MDRVLGWVRDRRPALSLLGALVAPCGVAALLVPFRGTFTDAAGALVLVAVITLVAVPGTRAAGYVASLSAGVWFDFFLTRPYDEFLITRRPDIEITVSLFVVGVVITELAQRNRSHHHKSEESLSYVELIYGVSELVTSGRPLDEIAPIVSGELVDLLRLRACQFQPGLPAEGTPELGHDGRVRLGLIDWPVETWGLPGSEVSLVVRAAGRPAGRFRLTPTVGVGVSLERRLVAVALADQLGALLLRPLRSA